jgi:hypothetical protein
VVFASHYLATRHADKIAASTLASLPLPAEALEASLWLRKLAR